MPLPVLVDQSPIERPLEFEEPPFRHIKGHGACIEWTNIEAGRKIPYRESVGGNPKEQPLRPWHSPVIIMMEQYYALQRRAQTLAMERDTLRTEAAELRATTAKAERQAQWREDGAQPVGEPKRKKG